MSYTTVTLPHASQRVNPAGFCERVNGIWFVCLETSNDLMYSTSNGTIWTKADDSETTHTGVVTNVGWDGTYYVRIRGGLMAYSTDLQAWTAKASARQVDQRLALLAAQRLGAHSSSSIISGAIQPGVRPGGQVDQVRRSITSTT